MLEGGDQVPILDAAIPLVYIYDNSIEDVFARLIARTQTERREKSTKRFRRGSTMRSAISSITPSSSTFGFEHRAVRMPPWLP